MTNSETPEDTMTTMARADSDEGSVKMQLEPSEEKRGSKSATEFFSLLEDDCDYDLQCVEQQPRTWARNVALALSLLCLLGVSAWCGAQFGARQLQRSEDSGEALGEASGKCIVDLSIGNGGDKIELQRLSGERTSISLRRDEDPTNEPVLDAVKQPVQEAPRQPPVQVDVGVESPPQGKENSVENRPLSPPPPVAIDVDQYPDLTCSGVTHREWQEFKQLSGKWFGSWSSGVVPKSKAQLSSLTELAVRKLHAVSDQVDECAMGRLFVSLLAISAGEGTLKSMQTIRDPLLTILLDVPWSLVMRSGWPLFALLSQMHLHRASSDDLPTSGPDAMFFQALSSGLMNQQHEELAILGAEFVRAQQEGNVDFLVFPTLCAISSQLLAQVTFGGAQAEQALTHLQGFFRQAVTNIDDLQATIDTSWPLYGLLNAADTLLG